MAIHKGYRFLFGTGGRWSGLFLWLGICFIQPGWAVEQEWSVSITRAAGGELVLEWPAVENAVGYRVEVSDTLTPATWAPVAPVNQWPITATTLMIADPGEGGFFRVVALVAEVDAPGQLIELIPIDSYTTAELSALFQQQSVPITPTHPVHAFKVLYRTLDPQGEIILASGALMLPQDLGDPLPWMSYQHGTIVLKDDVPSRGENLEYLIGLVYASHGYIATEPDYIGLGDSPGLHPYMHAETEAMSGIDLLRAVQGTLPDWGIDWDGRLFLSGYSQGGHSTMAMHRMIQDELAGEFTVTASCPMAGPHDVSGTMSDLMLADAPANSPYYLPYVIFSYQSAYGLYDDVHSVFKEPYATTLPPLFDGMHSGGQIDAAMPAIPREILQDDLLAELLTDPEHPFRLALEANDTYLWTPQSRLRMYHCGMDSTVPYANSQIAYQWFMNAGVSTELVQLVDPFSLGSHGSCIPFAFLSAKSWFDTLK